MPAERSLCLRSLHHPPLVGKYGSPMEQSHGVIGSGPREGPVASKFKVRGIPTCLWYEFRDGLTE